MKPKTAAELAATLRAQVEADAAERLRAGLTNHPEEWPCG